MDAAAGMTSLGALRRAARMTQEELAERSGLTVRAISNLERGQISRARLATLTSLARALNLTDDEQARFIAELRQFPVSPGPESRARNAPGPVARQLPARAPGFAGREAELSALVEAIGDPENWAPTLVTGLGGIGKTALAVEAGARVASAFPGGQLYTKLSTSEGAVREPGRVLGEFLRAVGVPPRSVPATIGERTRLWRTVTAESSVLLLLDDAASEAQVRPLLPAESSRVVITSRKALGGLDAGVRVRLGPVDPEAAELMLAAARGLKDSRGDGLTRLIQACAGMPLALRLIAARLAMAPHMSFDAMADRLSRELSLDTLSSGDRRVASSIAASVGTLEPTALATVTDLAQLSLPTFADWHLAALSGLSQSQSSRMADELVASGLLDAVPLDDGAFRYTLHDLVRVYLREHGGPLHLDAMDRLLAWAVHLQVESLDSAIARPIPHVLWPPRPGGLTDALAEIFVADKGQWFDAEYPSLLALMDACIAIGKSREAGALLAAVRQPMTRSGLLDELIAAAERCVEISTADALGRACAELVIGSASAELGNYADARRTIGAALTDLSDADACTLAGAWYEIGWLHHRDRGRDDPATAIAAYERSIELHRSIANSYGELGAICGLVELLHTDAADNTAAREYARQAITLAAGFDDYRTVIKVRLTVWRSLDGGLDEHIDALTEALELARMHRDAPPTVTCLTALSRAHRESGEAAAALEAALEAVRLAKGLRRPAELDAAVAELGRVNQECGGINLQTPQAAG